MMGLSAWGQNEEREKRPKPFEQDINLSRLMDKISALEKTVKELNDRLEVFLEEE